LIVSRSSALYFSTFLIVASDLAIAAWAASFVASVFAEISDSTALASAAVS